MTTRTSALAALLLFSLPLRAQQPTATLTGRILDLQTGEPIAKANVSIAGQPISANTTDDGRFTLTPTPGTLDLRVFTVGYGLLKKRIELAPGATLTLDLRLGQEALRDTQQITVTAGPFDPVVPDAVTQYSLNSTELQNLSTVLANDPLRAVANLPGVSSDQDYYASFAVRGAGPAHIGIYIDGVLIDHPSYSLEDSGELGSLSVINGEEVGSLSLLPGAFPASYADRTGAILDITTRDGARDRITTRFIADFLGAVLTSEGPIGHAHKASWLASARQSYLAYLFSRLNIASSLTLNYRDALTKLTYDLNPRHKFTVDVNYGATSAQRNPLFTAGQTAAFFTNGAAQHGTASLHWDWTLSPNTLLQSQGFWTHDTEHDTYTYSTIPDLDTASNVFGLRQDLTHQFPHASKLQAGLQLRAPNQFRNSAIEWNYTTHTLLQTLIPFDHYSQSAAQPGGYIQNTATFFKNRLTLSAGLRADYFTPTSETVLLPHASALLHATRLTNLTLAFGQYAQAPTLQQLFGAFGTPFLQSERATHETAALDQILNEKTRVHIEFYNRLETNDINETPTEFRLLPNNQVAFPTLGPTLANNLNAYARGFEISLQRRSANRLSGFIAYARGYSKFWQPSTTLSFSGDFDQRNTFSAYGAYRITRTINLSANTRYGSGTPIPGFLAPTSTSENKGSVAYLLSQSRNTLRKDDYQRTDIRINKVFTPKHFNLTLHAEIENLTAHTNYSFYDFASPYNVSANHAVDATRQSTLPFLPAAGLTLEF